MSRTFNGTSDYLQATDSPITAYPFTLSVWLKPASNASGTALSLANTNVSPYVALALNATPIGFAEVKGTSVRDALATAGIAAGTWGHLCVVVTSALSTTVYVNGANSGTNTTNNPITFSGLTLVIVGALQVTTGTTHTSFRNGSIGEAAVWNTALTSTDITNLAAGTNPTTVEPTNLQRYWRLNPGDESPEPDYLGLGPSLVLTGTTSNVGDDPPVSAPGGSGLTLTAAGGSATAIGGTVTFGNVTTLTSTGGTAAAVGGTDALKAVYAIAGAGSGLTPSASLHPSGSLLPAAGSGSATATGGTVTLTIGAALNLTASNGTATAGGSTDTLRYAYSIVTGNATGAGGTVVCSVDIPSLDQLVWGGNATTSGQLVWGGNAATPSSSIVVWGGNAYPAVSPPTTHPPLAGVVNTSPTGGIFNDQATGGVANSNATGGVLVKATRGGTVTISPKGGDVQPTSRGGEVQLPVNSGTID